MVEVEVEVGVDARNDGAAIRASAAASLQEVDVSEDTL